MRNLYRETRNITLPNCFGSAKVYLKNIYGKYFNYKHPILEISPQCQKILLSNLDNNQSLSEGVDVWAPLTQAGTRISNFLHKLHLSLVGRTNISCTACLMAKIYPLKAQINTYSQWQPSCRRVPTLPVARSGGSALHGTACGIWPTWPGLLDPAGWYAQLVRQPRYSLTRWNT